MLPLDGSSGGGYRRYRSRTSRRGIPVRRLHEIEGPSRKRIGPEREARGRSHCRTFRLLALGAAAAVLASGCALQDTRYDYSRNALPFADYDESILDWNFPTSTSQGPLLPPERLHPWRPAIGVPWATAIRCPGTTRCRLRSPRASSRGYDGRRLDGRMRRRLRRRCDLRWLFALTLAARCATASCPALADPPPPTRQRPHVRRIAPGARTPTRSAIASTSSRPRRRRASLRRASTSSAGRLRGHDGGSLRPPRARCRDAGERGRRDAGFFSPDVDIAVDRCDEARHVTLVVMPGAPTRIAERAHRRHRARQRDRRAGRAPRSPSCARSGSCRKGDDLRQETWTAPSASRWGRSPRAPTRRRS